MKAEREGVLQVKRISRRRQGKDLLGNVLADLIQPLYFPRLQTYVKGDEQRLWRIDGRGGESLTLEDNDRPVRVVGQLRLNRSTPEGHPREIGVFTRAKVEFLD